MMEDDSTAEDRTYDLDQRIRIHQIAEKALADKILRMKEQIRNLNATVIRRKWALRKHRDYTDAVKKLHRPLDSADLDRTTCRECGQQWPCRTHSAIMAVLLDQLPESMRNMLTDESD
jgi:hypothetical protein